MRTILLDKFFSSDSLDKAEKCIDHSFIKLCALATLELRRRNVKGKTLSVCSVRNHRVKRVGNGDNARSDRNVGARNTVGVSAAVDSFVMALDYGEQRFKGSI